MSSGPGVISPSVRARRRMFEARRVRFFLPPHWSDDEVQEISEQQYINEREKRFCRLWVVNVDKIKQIN